MGSEEKKEAVVSLPNDLAVSVNLSKSSNVSHPTGHANGPHTQELEKLNLAIATMNDAAATIEKITDLVKSLGGFQEQINSPTATERQSSILKSEASVVGSELEKALAHESLKPFTKQPITLHAIESLDTKVIELANKTSLEIKNSIEQRRFDLNRELARLETAHLNSESSHCAVRDIEQAFSLVSETRRTLTNSPDHAVEACGALGARARSLLLHE